MNYLVNTCLANQSRFLSQDPCRCRSRNRVNIEIEEGGGGWWIDTGRGPERFFTVEKPWRGGTVADERDGRSIPRRTDVDINNDPRTFV